jgi:hypothetical protein
MAMTEVTQDQLKRAVESQHGCTATFLQTLPVKETFSGKTVWDGRLNRSAKSSR